MKANDALRAAHVAGVSVRIDGNDLVLEASAAPPPAMLDLLARHKAGIVALLRPPNAGRWAEDWMAFYHERARVAEFDGRLPREEAEARAFACCVVEWLNRNPERSSPGRCHGCGQAEHAHDRLLPFGTEGTGHTWLHSRCWPAWHNARKANAIISLAAIGIDTPRTNR
jgi:hypothetical protein